MVKIKRKEKRPVSNVLATTERKERKVRYGVDLRDHNYKYYTMLKIYQLYELCTQRKSNLNGKGDNNQNNEDKANDGLNYCNKLRVITASNDKIDMRFKVEEDNNPQRW